MRTTRISVLTISAALLLGGCADPAGPGGPDVKVVAVSAMTSVDPSAFADRLMGVLEKAKSVQVNVTTGNEAPLTVTLARISANRVDASVTGSGPEVRLVDGVVYLKRDVGWARMPVPPGMMSMAMTAMFGSGGLPAKLLAQGTTTSLGTEADGEHYRIVLPVRGMLSMMTGPMRDMMGIASPTATSAPRKTGSLSLDLWLDPTGRPVRAVLDRVGRDGHPVTARFTGWDAPVSIVAPPASEVTTMPRPSVAD